MAMGRPPRTRVGVSLQCQVFSKLVVQLCLIDPQYIVMGGRIVDRQIELGIRTAGTSVPPLISAIGA